jgi:hypothetical protein
VLLRLVLLLELPLQELTRHAADTIHIRLARGQTPDAPTTLDDLCSQAQGCIEESTSGHRALTCERWVIEANPATHSLPSVAKVAERPLTMPKRDIEADDPISKRLST